jgi:hypothetical protein
MDIGKAFTFPFDDEGWVSSILICGALMFLPIVGWLAIAGYTLQVARNVAMGSPRPLPRWDDFSTKLSLGFSWFLIYLAYSAPVIILSFVAICAFIPGIASGNDGLIAASVGLYVCIIVLAVLLSIALAPVLLAATARYLQYDSLSAAFQVREVLAMVREDIGGWLVLWLLSILASFVGSVGAYVFVIGMLFTLPYGQAIFGHLLGQKLLAMRRPGGLDYAPPTTF